MISNCYDKYTKCMQKQAFYFNIELVYQKIKDLNFQHDLKDEKKSPGHIYAEVFLKAGPGTLLLSIDKQHLKQTALKSTIR